MAEVGDLVFLDLLSESSRCFPDVGGLTPICLAFPAVDNILLLVNGDFVFGVHEHGFEGVHPFETNLYGGVLEDPFKGLTQT